MAYETDFSASGAYKRLKYLEYPDGTRLFSGYAHSDTSDTSGTFQDTINGAFIDDSGDDLVVSNPFGSTAITPTHDDNGKRTVTRPSAAPVYLCAGQCSCSPTGCPATWPASASGLAD